MTTLAKWQSFARSTGLKGWSRFKKDDLIDFLVENLWKKGSGKPKMKKRNPLMKKNKKINVPFLIPEKRKILPRVVPGAIRENIMHVVDWAKWLESVEDAEIREKSTLAVEKLKKKSQNCGEKNLLWKKANPLLENSQDNLSFAGMILFPPKSFSGKQEGK